MTCPLILHKAQILERVPLSDTGQKNHLNHFGQVIFDMTNLISGLFY